MSTKDSPGKKQEKPKLVVDKMTRILYYNRAGSEAKTWRSRVAGRARTIGNRVYPKRVSRVQIPPSPPKSPLSFDAKEDFSFPYKKVPSVHEYSAFPEPGVGSVKSYAQN